jgi:hypothetical protein
MILDLVDPAELSLAARMLDVPQFTLSRWLPNRQRDAIDYRFTRRARSQGRAAAYRAYDTPAIIRPRPGGAEVRGQLPPISVQVPLGEEDQLRLNQARAEGAADYVAEAFNDDAGIAVRSVAQRLELARGQALTHGRVSIGTAAQRENGLFLEADFGMPGEHYITAPVLWDSADDVDIIGQLEDWIAIYSESTGGMLPGVMVGSRAIRSALLRNVQIRELAGAPTSLNAINVAGLNAVLDARDIPPMEVYDVQIMDHTGTMRRPIDADRLLLLPSPGNNEPDTVGVTQFGRTLEADELVRLGVMEPSVAAGLVVVPYRTENPISYSVLATAIALPTVANPELVFSVKVVA